MRVLAAGRLRRGSVSTELGRYDSQPADSEAGPHVEGASRQEAERHRRARVQVLLVRHFGMAETPGFDLPAHHVLTLAWPDAGAAGGSNHRRSAEGVNRSKPHAPCHGVPP